MKFDSISLSNWTTVSLVLSDTVWWWRDFDMGGFDFRLGIVAVILIGAYAGYLISAIWYHKEQKEQDK